MDTKSAVEALKEHVALASNLQKRVKSVEKELGRGGPDSAKLLKEIAAIDALLAKAAESNIPFKELGQWLSGAREQVEQLRERAGRTLGTELARELEPMGIKLSGQAPELRAGIFTVELLTGSNRVKVWYGPRQEMLAEAPVDAMKISQLIEKSAKTLGSGLEPEELKAMIAEAIRAESLLSARPEADAAPIIGVLAQLQLVMQSSGFKADPSAKKYHAYTRADFSYDLFSKGHSLGAKLVVATQAKTKKRTDFLWVPKSEEGQGTMFSHIDITGAADGTDK